MEKKLLFKCIFLRTTLLIMLIVCFASIQNQRQARAEPNEQTVKFYVSPLKTETPVPPGGTLTKEITIINQRPTLLTIKTYVMDYEIKKNNSFEFFPPGYKTYSCANWIRLSETSFTLEGNQEKKISLTIDVPANAEPTGHYAVVFFESVGKPLGESTTGVVTQGRIGTLILQQTPGAAKIVGKIKEFKITRYVWSMSSFLTGRASRSIPWEMVFNNSGNTHLDVESKVEILNSKKRSVYVSDQQRITSLPDTDREHKGIWKNIPSFGKFTAVLEVSYSGKTEYRTLTLYVIPVGTLLIILISLVILIILGIFLYKWGKKRGKRASRIEQTS